MLEQCIALLQAWVCIHLDQDRIQVLIKDEVVAQKLIVVLLQHHFAFDRFDRVSDDIYSALFELIMQLSLRPVVAFRIFGDEVEKGICRYNVSLFEFPVFFARLLDRIICELHEQLLFIWQVRVMILVLLATCPDIALSINIDLAVCCVEERPHSDVKLSFEVEHRNLYQFLYHKGVTPDLLFTIGINVLS